MKKIVTDNNSSAFIGRMILSLRDRGLSEQVPNYIHNLREIDTSKYSEVVSLSSKFLLNLHKQKCGACLD